MPSGKKTGQRQSDLFLFPEDDRADLIDNILKSVHDLRP
jgi:hypothetical protein